MLPNWSGQTVVCIASGPSLTPEDCDAVALSGRPAIVTNTTFRSCLWAQVLFGHDVPWWRRYIAEVREVFRGRLFCKSPRASKFGVEWLGIHSFGLSGTDSMILALALGSRRILLLGHDCQMTDGKAHHHGDHPEGLDNCNTIKSWPTRYGRAAAYLKKHGAEVINVSRATALECFPRSTLAAEL